MAETNVIERLFNSITSGDLNAVRECFTSDARIWHGYDCEALDLHSFLEGLKAAFDARMPLRYDDIRRMRTEDGFVQQHLFVAPAGDGKWTGKPCCNVFHLKDGLIWRVEEYVDRTGVVQLNSLPALTPGI